MLVHFQAAEAQATSPLNYDHDDQENTSESERQDSEPINHATPASLLQQKEEEAHVIKETAMVAEALYADRPPFGSAYGLGLSFMDGSNDSHVRRV